MFSDPIKLGVSEVRTAVPAGPGVEAGLVVLQEVDPPYRLLRIVVGQPEARAIHSSWLGQVAARPGTWDLFVSTVALLDGRLVRAVITAVEDDRHFFATVELEKDGRAVMLTCRPSDAIALALRAWGAEIFAERSVLDSAGRLADGTRPEPPAPAAGPPAVPSATVPEELQAAKQEAPAGWGHGETGDHGEEGGAGG